MSHSAFTIQFSECLTSRILHDLMSPASAIKNGVELLNDMGADANVIDLIEKSAQQLQNRLQYYRLAFGMAGGKTQDQQRWFEAEKAILNYLSGGKIHCEWRVNTEDTNISLPVFKSLLNMVFVAEEALPRGGEVIISNEGPYKIYIQAIGPSLCWQEARWQPLLDPHFNVADISHDHIPSFLIHNALQEEGVQCQIEKVSDSEIAVYIL